MKPVSKDALPMDFARNIMMICKEALTNILRHSQASKASVETGFIEINKIKLVIADNGKGFNTKTTEYGNGLHNMRQRAEYLQAKMEICSDENAGTRITLTISIPTNNGLLYIEK